MGVSGSFICALAAPREGETGGIQMTIPVKKDSGRKPPTCPSRGKDTSARLPAWCTGSGAGGCRHFFLGGAHRPLRTPFWFVGMLGDVLGACRVYHHIHQCLLGIDVAFHRFPCQFGKRHEGKWPQEFQRLAGSLHASIHLPPSYIN